MGLMEGQGRGGRVVGKEEAARGIEERGRREGERGVIGRKGENVVCGSGRTLPCER